MNQIFEPKPAAPLSRVAVAVQTKLAVNQSGDVYEREADRMADQVMRMPRPSIRKKTDGLQGGIARKADRGDNSLANHQPPGWGLGQTLDRSTRDFFEPRFGHDFSQVRIHADAAAAETSAQLGARAFALGNEIWFGSRQYQPDTADGKHLLAHELTHVIQQGKSDSSAPTKHQGNTTAPLAGLLSAAPAGQVHAAPAVTGITLPAIAEVGVGPGARTIAVAAVVAGNPQMTWTVVGAPVGVTVTGPRRQASVNATAVAPAAAGGTFQVRAALTATPGDIATSANIRLVGISSVTLIPAPAFANQPRFSGGILAAPVVPAVPAQGGVADPNRDGLAGNTANATVITAPAGRANTLSLPTALGATVGANVVTPGRTTGIAQVRATDTATQSRRDVPLTIQSVSQRVRGFGAQAASPNGIYGPLNTIRFAFTDASGTSANRAVGETITAGARDDFGFTAGVNSTLAPPGPNPAPDGPRSAAANNWNDNLFTPAGAAAGAAGDANMININRYVGPGAAATLPRIGILRQGFHFRGWGGLWSNEVDNGIHRRSLIGPAAAPQFRTEHIFPGGSALPWNEPYAGPPLVTLSALAINTAGVPAVPLAAGGLAADGVAVAGATVATTVAGRTVNWRPVGAASIAFNVPAIGAAAAVGAAAIIQAGLVPGTFRIRVADAVFPNRRLEGNVSVVAVRLRGMAAPVTTVPAGTLVAIVNLTADPGGRVVNWTVDPVAAAAGVTVVGAAVAGVAAAAAARTATVTRPAAFTGRVTVRAADSIRPAANASIVITFR